MSKRVVVFGVVAWLSLAALIDFPIKSVGIAEANSGCPESTDAFGNRHLTGDCIVDGDTTWGNGTLTLAGNLTVQSEIRLTLWNMSIVMDPSYSQEYRIYLAGGQLVAHGGSLTSNNTDYAWRLETNSGSGVALNLQGVNVSFAGGGSYSALHLAGGSEHRLENLTFEDSGRGISDDDALILLDGAGITDVRVRNNLFLRTGRVLYVRSVADNADVRFTLNDVRDFDESGGVGVVFARDANITYNSIEAGTSKAIELEGGGPGWPSKNLYNISHNTISTSAEAIHLIDSKGYDISWNQIGGHVVLAGNGNFFGHNNISDVDMRNSPGHIGHIVISSPNSTIRHNVLWNVTLTTGAGIVVSNYGNVSVHDNSLYLKCYGSNCMATEVINVQEEQREVYPGFPTVEISWNEITWTEFGPDAISIMLDNEFSRRLYLHNNTERVTASTGRATSSLHGGGVLDSVYENNTIQGPTTYCIYHYIYEQAHNLFEHNRCQNAVYGGIFQTGNNTYRHNSFEEITHSGLFICPDSPCAGSTANTASNAWFNNSFTFSGGLNLTRMQPSNAFANTFVGHGAPQWTEDNDGPTHPVHGGWLFFANQSIDRIEFANHSDGSRRLFMTVGGQVYWDWRPTSGATDDAALSIDAIIDKHGSHDKRTVLWRINPRGETNFNLMARGVATVWISDFEPNHLYNVTVLNYTTSTFDVFNITSNGEGRASFSMDIGPDTHRFNVTIAADTAALDTTPPSQVTDLQISESGPDFATLRWTAPGDDGTEGQATAYEIRFSTEGPLNDSNFGSGTSITPPLPAPPGTLQEFNVTGLISDTEYWFALRTADEVPNWSPVSNSPSVTTLPAEEPDSEAPSVWFLSPSDGDAVSGDVTVSLEASDNVGVQQVALWVNDTELARFTTLPYEWTWSTDGLGAGPYVLTAAAYDLVGNEGTDAITVHVLDPGDPESPRIESVVYRTSEHQIEVLFSKSMDQASVENAFVILPALAYAFLWQSPRHAIIAFQEAPVGGETYWVYIASRALDVDGRPLAHPLNFFFEVPPSPEPSSFYLNPWLWALILVAAWWIVSLAMFLRSEKRLSYLRAATVERLREFRERYGPSLNPFRDRGP